VLLTTLPNLAVAADKHDTQAESQRTQSNDAARSAVIVLDFKGAEGGHQARAGMVRKITAAHDVEVLGSARVKAIAEKLDADPNEPAGRAEIARALNASIWVEGTVSKARRTWRTQLRVYDADTGRLVAKRGTSGRNLRAMLVALNQLQWKTLHDHIDGVRTKSKEIAHTKQEDVEEEAIEETSEDTSEDSAVVAVQPASEKSESTDEGEEKPAVEKKESPERDEAVVCKREEDGADEEPVKPPPEPEPELNYIYLTVSGSLFTRDLVYNPDLRYAKFPSGIAPAVAIEGEWYPFIETKSFMRNVGFEGAFTTGIGITVDDVASNQLDANFMYARVGLRARVPFDGNEIALAVGYGAHIFMIDDAGQPTAPDYPDVNYNFVRFALSARLSIYDTVLVRPRVAWLHTLSAGDISKENWLNDAKVVGIEVGLTLGYDLGEGWEVQAGGDLRQFALHSRPWLNPVTADYAIDRYITGRVGVAWSINQP